MASSGEIAAMFTAQNEQFMGRNAFANTIGIATPANSLGAYGHYGLMGGFQRPGGGFPGMAGPSPVWGYGAGGPVGVGYGAGSAFAGGAVSAIGGAATMGMAGLSLAAGFGKLGGLGSLMFDPLSSGWGGFAASRAAGMGVAGAMGMGALAAAPAMAIGGLAAHGIGSFVHGAQGQSAIAGQLGQHSFINSGSRTGMGFTRDDAQAFGNTVRQLAHVPEMLTSVDELTRLLPQLRKAGNFQGIKDIGEFQDRFKESVKTIKTMSKMLGTTMEEAAEFFAHSRSVGFLGKQAQLANVLNSQYTSGMSGMSMQQTMGLQQAGAAAFRQQGISGRIGAQAYTNWAQQLSFAQQNGMIGEGALEDMTGLQGPEAVAAAAQRFGNAAYEMTQNSAAGRLLTYGMMSFDSSGKATGVDKELLARFKRGEVSYHELKSRAGRLTDTQKVSATARLKDVGGLLAGAGPDAIGRVLQDALTEQYGDSTKGREALNLMLQRNAGLSANESDIIMGQIGTGPSGTERETLAKTQMQRSLEKEKYSPSAMWKRFKTKASSAMGFTALEQAGAEMQNSFAKAYEEFWDDVFDRNVVQVSKEGAAAFKAAMGGNDSELKKMFAEANGIKLDSLTASGSGMSTGRFSKMLIGGAVGIGAGLLTANPLVGGAAAAATMSLMDSSGGTEGLTKLFTGGMSEEEISRLTAQGKAFNNAGLDISALDKYGFTNAKGREAELRQFGRGSIANLLTKTAGAGWGDLSAAERGEAIKKGAGDYYAQILAEKLGVGGAEASLALGQYMHGQDYYGGAEGGANIGVADIDEAAKSNPELAMFLASAKQNGAGARSYDEWAAGGAAGLGAGAGIDFTFAAGRSSKDLLDIKKIAAEKSRVSESFSSIGIDSGLQEQLGKSKNARSLTTALAKGDSAVRDAVMKGDVAALQEKFPGATLDDIRIAQKAWGAANEKGESQKLIETLNDSGKISSREQIQALTMSAKDSYDEFSNVLGKSGLTGSQLQAAGALQSALGELSSGTIEGFESGRNNAAAAVQKLVEEGAKLDEKGLAEFTGKLGKVGERIGDSVRGIQRLRKSGGNISMKELSAITGFAEGSDDLKNFAAGHGIGSGKTLSKEEMSRLERDISTMKVGETIAAAGSTKGKGDKDQEIMALLKTMQKNADLQTSLLMANNKEVMVNGQKATYDSKTGKVTYTDVN